MDIILAPWGDPHGWKIISYRYNEKITRSFSSSLALADMLNISNENIIAILSSTLIDSKVTNYDVLRETISRDIYDYVKKRNNSKLLDNKDIIPRIWVVPSIGTFGKDRKFIHQGSTGLFYNNVYYNTFRLLEDINASIINLHIDLTHGINYMPVLSLNAIKLAASAFASMTGRYVNIYIYNSDPLYPFPRDDNPNIILDINNIHRLKYNGHRSLQGLLMQFVLNYDWNVYNWKRVSASDECVDVKYIYKGAKSAAMGLLLIAGSIMDRLKAYKDIINMTLDNLSKLELECTEKHDSIIIEYKIKLTREASLLHAIINSLTSIDIGEEVKLSELKRLNKEYYKDVVDPIYNTVADEIDHIEKGKDDIDVDYKLYGEIKYGINFDPAKACKPNKRNLYAHAGFEENAIYLKKNGDEVYLSYRDCLNAVLDNI